MRSEGLDFRLAGTPIADRSGRTRSAFTSRGLEVTRDSSRKIPGKLILTRREGRNRIDGNRADRCCIGIANRYRFPDRRGYHPQLTSFSRKFAGNSPRSSPTELCLKTEKKGGGRRKPRENEVSLDAPEILTSLGNLATIKICVSNNANNSNIGIKVESFWKKSAPDICYCAWRTSMTA